MENTLKVSEVYLMRWKYGKAEVREAFSSGVAHSLCLLMQLHPGLSSPSQTAFAIPALGCSREGFSLKLFCRTNAPSAITGTPNCPQILAEEDHESPSPCSDGADQQLLGHVGLSFWQSFTFQITPNEEWSPSAWTQHMLDARYS